MPIMVRLAKPLSFPVEWLTQKPDAPSVTFATGATDQHKKTGRYRHIETPMAERFGALGRFDDLGTVASGIIGVGHLRAIGVIDFDQPSLSVVLVGCIAGERLSGAERGGYRGDSDDNFHIKPLNRKLFLIVLRWRIRSNQLEGHRVLWILARRIFRNNFPNTRNELFAIRFLRKKCTCKVKKNVLTLRYSNAFGADIISVGGCHDH
jgi:hypothetical protein